jgi:hypothetical protein
MNKVVNGLGDLQIIEGIEATVGHSSDRTNQPRFFTEAKGGDRDTQLLSCPADSVNGVGFE